MSVERSLPSPAVAAPAEPAAPAIPTGAALPCALAGRDRGVAQATADRQTAWEAQVAALDSGQRRSWRGSQGVFGYVEAGSAATGDGCRAYSQTIYIAGRPELRPWRRLQAAGWKLENDELRF